MSNTIKWQPEHFPIGTVVEVQVGETDPYFATVKNVDCNGPASYVLTITDLFGKGAKEVMDRCNEMEISTFVNITHVKRIINRPNTEVIWDENDHSFYYGAGMFGKHHSKYKTCSLNELVYETCRSMRLTGVMGQANQKGNINFSLLTDMIMKQGAGIESKYFNTNDKFRYCHECKVSKKKLKRDIKRMINKCLVKTKQLVKEEREFYNQSMNDFDDVNFEINEQIKELKDDPSNVGLIKNEDNKTYVYLEDNKWHEVPDDLLDIVKSGNYICTFGRDKPTVILDNHDFNKTPILNAYHGPLFKLAVVGIKNGCIIIGPMVDHKKIDDESIKVMSKETKQHQLSMKHYDSSVAVDNITTPVKSEVVFDSYPEFLFEKPTVTITDTLSGGGHFLGIVSDSRSDEDKAKAELFYNGHPVSTLNKSSILGRGLKSLVIDPISIQEELHMDGEYDREKHIASLPDNYELGHLLEAKFIEEKKGD